MANSHEERRSITEVRDIPTAFLLKIIIGSAVVIMGLVTYIGDSFIAEQRMTNKNLGDNTKAIIKILGIYRTHDGRILRNENDIQSNSDRIYKIEVK